MYHGFANIISVWYEIILVGYQMYCQFWQMLTYCCLNKSTCNYLWSAYIINVFYQYLCSYRNMKLFCKRRGYIAVMSDWHIFYVAESFMSSLCGICVEFMSVHVEFTLSWSQVQVGLMQRLFQLHAKMIYVAQYFF